MADTVKNPNIQEFVLEEDSELRFEAGKDEVTVELLKGSAEIFGSEIELHKKYTFSPGMRVAVFTWKGATVELIGKTSSAYVSKETPMVIYLNTHAALEQMRTQVEAEAVTDEDKESARGPRIMLVGPPDVGKTTVCRILCNYAVRQGRSPIFVDLDVGQNSISIPGTIGALCINRTADVIDGFDKAKPIVFTFGSVTPSDNMPLYSKQVNELAAVVEKRCKANLETALGGLVINTCGWVQGEGYDCIITAAEAFQVDVIVVLDLERLYNDLKNTLPEFVKTTHLPKSGGVEPRSREVRFRARNDSVQRYFYGTRQESCFPFTFDISFDDVTIVKVGTEDLPESCLPVGMKKEDYSTKVVPVTIGASLKHYVLAISHCKTIQPDLATKPLIGFMVVTNVNMEEKMLTVLSPQRELPWEKPILVLTKVQFLDDHNIRM